LSRFNSALLIGWIASAFARPAAAQTFPAANAWVALPCGAGPMVDAAGDTPGAPGALDLVGVPAAPAGFHAADATFLYLRMRVAGNPVAGGRLQANAWGWEFDLDGDRTTYELIMSVSGTGPMDQVALYRHTTTVRPNDPADPSALPPVFTYPATTHAQTGAAGTNLGGGADFFVDVALPWSDLATVGVAPATPVYVWAGSSTIPNALNLDLACGGGGPGTQLIQIPVGPTTPDPTKMPAPGTGPRTLEGGPGCSVAFHGRGSAGDVAWLALLIATLALTRSWRRYHRAPCTRR
jgi:hypothetical protein